MSATDRKKLYKDIVKSLAALAPMTTMEDASDYVGDIKVTAQEIYDDFDMQVSNFTNEGLEAMWRQNNEDKMDSWEEVVNQLDLIEPENYTFPDTSSDIEPGEQHTDYENETDAVDALKYDVIEAVESGEPL